MWWLGWWGPRQHAAGTDRKNRPVCGRHGGVGNLDGACGNATFYGIQSLPIDPAGNLMVVEAGNHVLRKISSDGTVGTVGTVAGGDMVAAFADGQGAAAKVLNPPFVAADTHGNWYQPQACRFLSRQDRMERSIGSVRTKPRVCCW